MPNQLSSDRLRNNKWPRELRVTWLLASLMWIGTVITGIALSWLMTTQNLGNADSPWAKCDATTGRVFSDFASTVVVLLGLFFLLPLFGRRINSGSDRYQPRVTKSITPVLLSWALGAIVNTAGIVIYSGLYCPTTNMISATTISADILIRLLASVFVIVPVIYAGSVEKSLSSAYRELAETSEALLEAAEEERTNLFDLVHGDIQGTLVGLEILGTRQSADPIKDEFFGLQVALIARELRTGPVAQVANVIGPVRILGTVESSIQLIADSIEHESNIELEVAPGFVELENLQSSHHYSEKFKVLLVRICQELILNAAKHSNTEGIHLSVGAEKIKGQQYVSISMENNSQESSFTLGRGLTEVSSRARLAGGDFAASLENNVFAVEVLLPVNSEN